GSARPSAPPAAEIVQLAHSIKSILDTIAAPLLERPGLGYETVGTLLCTAGDNPDRLDSDRSFAALCGTSPAPFSSGRSPRHRINRAGDRQANSALWWIMMV